jgi:hypothetical protein
MADAFGAAFSLQDAALSMSGLHDSIMLDMYFIYQLAQRPIRAIARKWMCRGLYRVTKGEYRCPECRQA